MELTTERLLLRELEESDAPACHAYERDPEVVRWQSHDVRTLDESLDYIRRVRAEQSQTPRNLYDLAVVLRASNQLIGRCGMAVEGEQARLWYVLRRDHWGHGYIPEAARALLQLAFGTLKLHRVTADIDPRNTPSLRVPEKLGFRREAHHLQNAFYKGEWSDSVIYAILASEWKYRR